MKKIFIALALMSLCLGAAAQQAAPFKDGDRIGFIGDSITDGGHYHSYIWLFYATRFPYMNIRIYNCGVGGDTAGNMLMRFDGDVLGKNPNYLTLTFGMNDSGYVEYKEEGAKEYGDRRFNECMESYKQIVKKLQNLSDTRVTMIGGSPYDNGTKTKGPFGYLPDKNEVMQRMSAEQEADAKANGWGYLDFSKPMLEIAAREQAKDSMFTYTGGDQVHPDNAGHMIMAYLFLKAQGLTGSKVADMQIDFRKAQATRSENCTISNISRNAKEIDFDYLSESLPYPLDTIAHGNGQPQSKGAELVPFMDEMNQELLSVKGLKGDWKVLIDNEEIGTWDGAELEKGINLATISWTPQYRQAQEVMFLNEYRWDIEETFREMAWLQYEVLLGAGVTDVTTRKAVETLDTLKKDNGWIGWHRPAFERYMHEDVRKIRWEQMESLADKMYELNKPVTHRITVKKI